MADTRWWHQETPIGTIRVVVGDDGLRHVDLPGVDVGGSMAGAIEERDVAVAAQLDDYFAGERRAFTIALDLSEATSPFRRTVLEVLHADVGFGETISYGELAERAGRPGAARAVGSAMASNPVPIVVPCHRVLAAGGAIGGYGGGIPMKRALLAHEGIAVDGGDRPRG